MLPPIGSKKPPRRVNWGCVISAVAFGLAALLLIVKFSGLTLVTETVDEGQPGARQVIYVVVVPPTATPKPAPTFTPTVARILQPGNAINSVPLSRSVVMPDSVKQRSREIYSKGRALGRNPRAFSKVGDSTMAYPPFLNAFDDASSYRLGAYAYLQGTIERFSGSFGRTSAAVKKGMHTWTEFDPTWVNSDQCQADEGPLACELRLNNPSVAIIRLGANDVPEPGGFNEQLRRIVEYCIARGIIPVLGTKPDRQEGPANTINKLIVQIASAYRIPLWDYDAIVVTVPGRGLEQDQIHMRGGGTHDYTSAAAFRSGDSLEDLTALMMLDALNREVMQMASQ